MALDKPGGRPWIVVGKQGKARVRKAFRERDRGIEVLSIASDEKYGDGRHAAGCEFGRMIQR